MKSTVKTAVTIGIAITIAFACLVLVYFAVTYFAVDSTVNYHVKTGSLSVKFERTYVDEHVLNSDGIIEHNTSSAVVNLNDDSKSIFNISNAAPQVQSTATLKVTNTGDVRTNYQITLLNLVVQNSEDRALADQICVYVYNSYGYELQHFILSTVLDTPTKSIVLNVGTGVILAGNQSDTFKVKAVFLDDEEYPGIDNNLAQGGKLSFDLQVYAEQYYDGK